jgi:hypothetical protein
MKSQNIPEGVYSQDVEEILSRKPSFVVRYGIPLIAFAFLLFLLISYFIPYPEKTTFQATTDAAFIPESLSHETAYAAVKFDTEYSDIFREGNSLTLFPGKKAPETGPVQAQVAGVVYDPGTGEKMVVIRMTQEAQVLLFGQSKDTEIKIITQNTNLLSRIFSPVLRLFKDPLSQMEQTQR